MNALPSLQTLMYDGWVIRLANGYTNRANSINPIYPSRIKLEEKIEYCDKLFSLQNLLPAYKLLGSGKYNPCDEYKALNTELEKLNYTIINETSIQSCEIAKPLNVNYEGMIINSDFSPRWIESVITFNQLEKKYIPTFKKMMSNRVTEKIVVSKEIENEIIGCGFGAIENNYVGIFDVIVKEEFRGNGYGREIVETILFEAGKLGAKISYLQAMLNNPIALHLYKKMGFKEVYRYWYSKKPEAIGRKATVKEM